MFAVPVSAFPQYARYDRIPEYIKPDSARLGIQQRRPFDERASQFEPPRAPVPSSKVKTPTSVSSMSKKNGSLRPINGDVTSRGMRRAGKGVPRTRPDSPKNRHRERSVQPKIVHDGEFLAKSSSPLAQPASALVNVFCLTRSTPLPTDRPNRTRLPINIATRMSRRNGRTRIPRIFRAWHGWGANPPNAFRSRMGIMKNAGDAALHRMVSRNLLASITGVAPASFQRA